MTSPSTRIRAALHRRWVLLVAAGAALALVGGGTSAALAAGTATPAPTSGTAAACAPGLARLLHASDRALRTDLQQLRKDAKDKTARAADRAEIKKKALAGEYGARTGRVARIASGDHAKHAALRPAALKADVKAARKLEHGSDARKAAVATVWSKALAGDYGSTWQTSAKAAKAKADQRCAAKARR